jgi:hypothetical protein
LHCCSPIRPANDSHQFVDLLPLVYRRWAETPAKKSGCCGGAAAAITSMISITTPWPKPVSSIRSAG